MPTLATRPCNTPGYFAGVDTEAFPCYNTHINKQGNTMQAKSIPSSTGGVITYTKTGLIHTAGKAYSGKIAAQEAKQKTKGK